MNTGGGSLRADARRNYAAILDAAREVFLVSGAGASLEEVARRAGVGIGTVYRRFADRDALLHALVLDALTRSCESAESAMADAADGLDGLGRYMSDALELQVSAIIPLALDRIRMDDSELTAARDASREAVAALIARAHEDGSLSRNVTFADLGTLLVRLARPLPGGVPHDVDADLARRQLRIVLAGLRAGGHDVLGQEGVSLAELRRSRER